MVTQIIAISLLMLYGVFDALKDKSSEGRFKNTKLNKANTWKNKYKLDEFGEPTYEERFLLSTTTLVFLTDFWHLMKWCQLRCLDIAFVLGTGWPLYWLILIPIFRGGIFELTHRS